MWTIFPALSFQRRQSGRGASSAADPKPTERTPNSQRPGRGDGGSRARRSLCSRPTHRPGVGRTGGDGEGVLRTQPVDPLAAPNAPGKFPELLSMEAYSRSEGSQKAEPTLRPLNASDPPPPISHCKSGGSKICLLYKIQNPGWGHEEEEERECRATFLVASTPGRRSRTKHSETHESLKSAVNRRDNVSSGRPDRNPHRLK